MATHEQIKDFWEWFSSHAPQFGDAFENEALLRQLDDLVTSIGEGAFAWEVGPGSNAKNAFTLSPGGDRELLSKTKAIVDAAPLVSDWEFHSAKPPKQWEGRFELAVDGGKFLEVDVTSWRCTLLKYADGFHEIVVEAPNLNSISKDDQRWAAEIALDGYLGERLRLETIDEVTVVAELSNKESAAAFPIVKVCERIK